jgi:hypothetical protein
MFGVGLVLWVACVTVTYLTGNPNLVPTLVLLGSFLVPVTFVAWAFERHESDEIDAGLLLRLFVVGGVLGVLGASVLEAYLPKSRFRQHGARVVQGQRMMQAASDIFLGWTKGIDVTREFYWRQLRDMKGSALVELMAPVTLTFYARTCGWTLARAHARSGDPVVLTSYLGRDDAFDRSITDFSERYADQNEKDYEEFVKAVRSGRLQAVEGV